MRRRLVTTALMAALAVPLGGCVVIPWPHTVRIVPTVDGVVTSHGEPITGLRVSVHERDPGGGDVCPASKVMTRTDKLGRFHFDEVTEFRLLMMMGDPLSTWTVCFAGTDGDVVGWRSLTLGYARPKAELSCDLKAAPKQMGGGRGVCTLVAD